MYQKPVYSPHIPYWRRLFVRVRNLTGENRSYWPRLTLGCTLSPSLDLRKIFLPLVVKEEEEKGKKRVNLLSTFFHLILFQCWLTHHPLIYKRSFNIYEHPGVIRQTVPKQFRASAPSVIKLDKIISRFFNLLILFFSPTCPPHRFSVTLLDCVPSLLHVWNCHFDMLINIAVLFQVSAHIF